MAAGKPGTTNALNISAQPLIFKFCYVPMVMS